MKEMPNNELDMDAYHSEGIDPGEHKVFNITPTIHSFNERFQGEPPVSAGPGLDKYNPDEMPPWWVKVIKPNTKWPGEGPQWDYGKQPDYTSPGAKNWILPYDPESTGQSVQKISEKQPPVGGPRGPFNLPLEGSSTGTRLGEVTTKEPFFKSPIRKNPDDVKDIERMYKEGKSMSEIGEYLGINRNQVNGLINRLGIRSQMNRPKPETNIIPKNKVPELDKDFDELGTWYQNQFEGGPSEREFRGMSPEDFNKFNEFQQRRMQTHVANDNKNLDLGTGGFDVDKALADFVKNMKKPDFKVVDKENGGILGNIEKAIPEKEMPRSQQEEHKYRKALGDQILKRNPPDENFTSDQWKKIAEKEGHVLEYTSSKRPNPYLAARRHSEGGKTTVIVSERFSGENKRIVFHNGEKIHSDWSPSEDLL